MVETGRKKIKDFPEELMGFVDDTNRLSASRIAEEIINKNYIITEEETDKIYIYREGIYYNNGEVEIKKQVKKLLGDYLNSHLANEIIFHIKTLTYQESEIFEQNKNLIHLKNGILDINTLELIPFNPKKPSKVQLPVFYDKEADCPKIKKFLKEITRQDEDIEIIQEMLGYTLYRDYNIAKSIMLLGGGANGKTTLINLIKSFLGSKNISVVALQDLEINRFAIGQLRGKLANLYPDLSSKGMSQISKFKALTGKDLITAEHKFGQPFTFTNYAKMIFSCNQLPRIREDSEAVWRRWIILVFEQTFKGEKADKKLINKLVTKEEMSGLLNWAIEGLKRLLENGDFSYSKTTDEIRKFYIKMSDPVKAFIDEKIIKDSNGIIFKDDLYGEFVEYCITFNLPTIADTLFSKKLIQQIPSIRSTRIMHDGVRKMAWTGIKLYEAPDEEEEDVKIEEKPKKKKEDLEEQNTSLIVEDLGNIK